MAFRTFHGRYLSADRDTPLVTTVESIGRSEHWTIILLDDEFNEFAICSYHNKYLCARGASAGATVSYIKLYRIKLQ